MTIRQVPSLDAIRTTAVPHTTDTNDAHANAQPTKQPTTRSMRTSNFEQNSTNMMEVCTCSRQCSYSPSRTPCLLYACRVCPAHARQRTCPNNTTPRDATAAKRTLKPVL